MLHQILLRYVTKTCIQCNKKAHRRGQERTSRRASAEVFSTTANPLPTSLLAGEELKVIADQLGHSSVVLTADTYLSVAVELGLKSAAAAARLVLTAGKRPPGGGNVRRPGAPVRAEIFA
jgi:integrase